MSFKKCHLKSNHVLQALNVRGVQNVREVQNVRGVQNVKGVQNVRGVQNGLHQDFHYLMVSIHFFS